MQVLDFEKPIFDMANKIKDMKETADIDLSEEITMLEEKLDRLKEEVYRNLTPWQRVQIARHADRPRSLDYIGKIATDFIELHGDRYYGDDHAIVCGTARIDGRHVMIVAQQKGKDTKSNIFRNFGMPNPEGYRKALRAMRIAAKFNRPIITLIDTPGAFPGIEAEERGQAEAIARNLFEMSHLGVPIICVIIGEGASGGALGIGVGDRILMMENTWYSVISPESCSSILWRSWEKKEQAAESLKLTAEDLIRFQIIDGIIKEPLGGAHKDFNTAATELKRNVVEQLELLSGVVPATLIENRILKYAQMGRVGMLNTSAEKTEANPAGARTTGINDGKI